MRRSLDMGAIDPILGIMGMKGASGLSLVTGEVPTLLLGGRPWPLTMPPLSPMMMEHLLGDVLSAEQRASLVTAKSLEADHHSATHGAFTVQARADGEKLTVILTRGARAIPAKGTGAPADIAPVIEVRADPREPTPPSPHVGGSLGVVLEQAIGRGASDLLFSSGTTPLLRIDGELRPCHELPATSSEALATYFEPHIPASQRAHYEATGSVDFSLVHGEWQRFRVNLFRHERGIAAALRPVWAEVPTLAELNLPATLTQLIELRHGLVLVTGATGSGKSTTLAALLEHLNRTRAVHLVTLEEPIEYAYRPQRALIHQREVGQHVDSFASGLRAALRENPDVLLVGELRDPATIRLALTAAQTGHLVLSTLHSGNAMMAVERLIAGFSEDEQPHVRQEVASTLRYVVAQRLVPAIAGGRVPVLERLTVNHAIAAQIREGRTHMLATQMEIGGDDGMVSMPRALADLVRAGRVTHSVAFAACDDREALEKLLEDRPTVRGR